ncbi:MAG: L,D-transpeptidase family protein [Mariprofundaceae bacterium]|nr:L,D-transpeptidase family protein [Mariprofundaceae bacterium]
MTMIVKTLLCCLLFAGHAWATTLPSFERQRIMQALHENKQDVIQQLDAKEKLVLQVALTLQDNTPEKTLALIRDIKSTPLDPLLAVMAAEAHRRLAIRAVTEAGQYAQTLQQQRKKLETIDLSRGLAEADSKLVALAEKLKGSKAVPLAILQLGHTVENVFLVDKTRARLFVYRQNSQGKLYRDADEYVVTGTSTGDKQKKGDKRTPNGVYHFIQQLNDPALHARYGPVSFPIDYPNALDVMHHKTGSGIWMHGYQQDLQRRAPQDTLGCFALPNNKLLAVAKKIRLHHSWVVIGKNIQYVDDTVRLSLRDNVLQAVTGWAKAWSSRNHAAYIALYDPRFHHERHDFTSWNRYKKRVNANKTYIKVSLSDITLIHDPERWPEGEVVVAEFTQDYKSSNLNTVGRKRLYWVRADAASPWKILIEQSIPTYAR